MYTDNGKHTIYDNVKPYNIVKADIKEFNDIKTTSRFKISDEKLDNYIQEYNSVSFPKFNFVEDNELFDLMGFGDVELMAQNPEYKYKYPKLSRNQLIQAEWETEQGIPNKLNRFLRQDATGESIEDIKEKDDAYNQGLQSLYNDIDKEAELIRNTIKQIDKDDKLTARQKINKKLNLEFQTNINKAKITKEQTKNPVLIKKAYEKPPIIKPALPPTPKPQPPTPQPTPIPQPPEGVEESKTTEPKKPKKPKTISQITISNPEEEKKLAKVQLLLKQKNAKKILEEKRKSINPADDKTVIETLNTPVEAYKVNVSSFKKLIDIYKDLPNNGTIDDLKPEDQVKMKGYMKFLGINLKTKKLEKLREKTKLF